MQTLELEADRALFEGKIKGLVVAFHEGERPLQGLAGLMDWRFGGLISRNIQAGALTGKEGECTYIPVLKNGRACHLILAGAGPLAPGGKREPVSPAALSAVRKNIASLKLEQIGISRADFGAADNSFFSKTLKGLPVWIAP